MADLAASFQEAVVDCLVAKALLAVERTGFELLCVGGGVAANGRLRERLTEETSARGIALHIPPLALCTDNAVMGAIAVERLKAGLIESLDLDVYPGLRAAELTAQRRVACAARTGDAGSSSSPPAAAGTAWPVAAWPGCVPPLTRTGRGAGRAALRD